MNEEFNYKPLKVDELKDMSTRAIIIANTVKIDNLERNLYSGMYPCKKEKDINKVLKFRTRVVQTIKVILTGFVIAGVVSGVYFGFMNKLV